MSEQLLQRRSHTNTIPHKQVQQQVPSQARPARGLACWPTLDRSEGHIGQARTPAYWRECCTWRGEGGVLCTNLSSSGPRPRDNRCSPRARTASPASAAPPLLKHPISWFFIVSFLHVAPIIDAPTSVTPDFVPFMYTVRHSRIKDCDVWGI